MKHNVGLVSLGCDKNRVDSEIMLAILSNNGYNIISDEKEADVIIVNTCGFIESAKEESINTILEMVRNKETGRCKSIIVTGCMAQRYKDELLKEIPEINAVVGTANYKNIKDILEETLSKTDSSIDKTAITDASLSYEKRMLTTPSHYAYVKIAEGCNNNCSYCIIPSLRGRFRSKPMEDIINEVSELVQNGVKEVILVAQDTTMYGIDLYEKKSTSELLKQLEKIQDLKWIRLMYSYPEEINDELIAAVKNSSKICHYFDIPLQHINNNILKSMRRRNTKEKTINLIDKIRREIPDSVIRTSLIVGYPGETQEEFNELVDFLRTYKLDRVGIFSYSQEEGTPAAELGSQIDETEKEKRKNKLMKVQNEISNLNNQMLVNRVFDVIIDGFDEKRNQYFGRTYGDAPEIDQEVLVNKGSHMLNKGDIVKVCIKSAYTYDLMGDVKDESSK